MPALVWWGRRWRTGADDFTFSSALYVTILVLCGVLGLTRVAHDRSSPAGGFNYLKSCEGASYALGAAFFGLSVADLIAAAFFFATALLSLRGAIYELSKRTPVPYSLHANALCVAVILVLTAVCAKQSLYDGERRYCDSLTGRILVGSLALNFAVCFMFALSLLLVFDPSGRKVYYTPEEYEQTWWKRCRVLCCRCHKQTRDDDAFNDVATVFSQAFCAYDMVPSDLAAGLLLLHGYQYHSRRLVRERVRFGPPLTRTGDTADSHRRERISSQAVPAKRLTAAQRELVRELEQYSRFYMAAYGYLLYEFKNCCTGLPRLCCFDPCMGCRHHSGRHYDASCFCNVAALLKESAIPEEDLLLTSWTNHLCQPVHYACYDRTSNAVVIAIRGTMSFIDVATDFAASPEVVALDSTCCAKVGGDKLYSPSDYYVHGGMLASARYVKRSLEYNGVLEQMLSGHYKAAKIVVLGHSLGGGVALILSVLLHSEFPQLRERLRCLAYAPPGGTMSEAVVEYCKGFTVGGFLGYDMIPRLALHTFDAFREAIFDVTAASPTPKSLVYLNAMRTPQVTRTLHPSAATPTTATNSERGAPAPEGGAVGCSPESAQYREELRHGSCVPLTRPKKLYPCRTLIHLRKAVERVSSACCETLSGETCGCCSCCGGPPSVCVEDVYYPCVEGPKDVQMLVAAPTMFTDHMPERFYDALKETVERMNNLELERFYQDEDPEELPESVAPLHYVSPTMPAAQQAARASDHSAPFPRQPTYSHEPFSSYGSIV